MFKPGSTSIVCRGGVLKSNQDKRGRDDVLGNPAASASPLRP